MHFVHMYKTRSRQALQNGTFFIYIGDRRRSSSLSLICIDNELDS